MAISLVGSSAVSGAAANGASITLTFATAPSSGDVIVVLNVDPRTGTAQTVTSGSGASYTALSSGTNGNLLASVWFRVAGSGETTAVCSHSGNGQDGSCCAAIVLRGAHPGPT